MRKYLSIVSFIAVISLFAASPSFSGELSGEEILKGVDATMTEPKTQASITNMVIIDSSGREKKRSIITAQEGDKKRIMKFISPADVKDISLLVLDEGDTIYNYLPSMRKIRRIATHVKDTNFAGTDFTFDDTATLMYGKDYSAKLIDQTDKAYVLELTPRPDAEVGYTKIKMWASKEGNFVVLKMEYYEGELKKTQTFHDYFETKGCWLWKKAVMHDIKKNHKTINNIQKLEVNLPGMNKVFKKRYLKTGRFDFFKK